MGTAQVIIDAIRIAIGIVFLLSFLAKLRTPRSFAQGVVEFRILPSALALGFGYLLLPLEALVAVSLLSDRMVAAGLVLSIILLTCFFVGVAMNLRRARTLACHCFGTDSREPISRRTLARIVMLLLGALVVLLGQVWITAPFSPYYGQWLLDSFLQLTVAVFVLFAGMWALTIPELLRPWKRILRFRTSVRRREQSHAG